MSTYLLVNLLSISMPFVLSFEPKFSFYKKFPAVITAIVPVAAFFIIWDVYFTRMGVWGFNPMHLSGLYLMHLPIEEWMFFVTIPFASLFTYEVVNYHFPKDYLKNAAKPLALVLGAFLIITGLFSLDKWYTSVTFLLAGGWLLINLLVFKAAYLGQFFIAYGLILIPFLLVNGVLTGSMIPEEVVYYNDKENLGIRLFTIPIEDSVYGMLLILMNVNIFEWFLSKNKKPFPRYPS